MKKLKWSCRLAYYEAVGERGHYVVEKEGNFWRGFILKGGHCKNCNTEMITGLCRGHLEVQRQIEEYDQAASTERESNAVVEKRV